jgi:hypothetical protein
MPVHPDTVNESDPDDGDRAWIDAPMAALYKKSRRINIIITQRGWKDDGYFNEKRLAQRRKPNAGNERR